MPWDGNKARNQTRKTCESWLHQGIADVSALIGFQFLAIDILIDIGRINASRLRVNGDIALRFLAM
jgi:hypothetical protein